MSLDNRWLLSHAANRHSQNGEDGIIEKILEVLGEPIGWCVEFGAWDGRHLSNTYALIEDKDFSAVLIEGSTERYLELKKSFSQNDGITPVNAFVGFTSDDGLDQILAKTDIPRQFDLLSIDIYGNDFHVWNAVEQYEPRVVVIEFNPTIPTAVDFVQAADMSVNQGCSILPLAKLASSKGYELICITQCNCIFVRAEYFDRFRIEDNSPAALRADESLITWLFCGYDGKVFVRGHGVLPWHGIPYRERKMQQVSRLFRSFQSNYGSPMRWISRQYRSIKKRGWI